MKVSAKNINSLSGKITLPSSKSISNRALIIQALCESEVIIAGLSNAEDTQILQQLLQNKSLKKNAGMAGTAYRFLTAYLAAQSGEYILTGAERMKERPIAPLVTALRNLGADLTYLAKEGYPPLQIKGKQLLGGHVTIQANVSSQYISALMMVAPYFTKPTTIELLGNIGSFPYINMTAAVMQHFGAEVIINQKNIVIQNKPYQAGRIEIEGDWSSASYFYSALALADEGTITLQPLSGGSWQGDAVTADIFYRLGIITHSFYNHIELTKSDNCVNYLEYNFNDCPDLAQTVICTCAGMGIGGLFGGMASLKIKETNRILALQNELAKIGWQLIEVAPEQYELSRNTSLITQTELVSINTYNDHRMAMSFAPLTLVWGDLNIENHEVVNKSFPNFWQEMQQLGFELTKK